MTARILLSLVLLSFVGSATAQVSYDQSKVTSDTIVDFVATSYRGIRTVDGTVYYLESDRQTLTAYTKEKIEWQVNIIQKCAPKTAAAEIRYMYLIDDRLRLVFGKNIHAEVSVDKGKVSCTEKK